MFRSRRTTTRPARYMDLEESNVGEVGKVDEHEAQVDAPLTVVRQGTTVHDEEEIQSSPSEQDTTEKDSKPAGKKKQRKKQRKKAKRTTVDHEEESQSSPSEQDTTESDKPGSSKAAKKKKRKRKKAKRTSGGVYREYSGARDVRLTVDTKMLVVTRAKDTVEEILTKVSQGLSYKAAIDESNISKSAFWNYRWIAFVWRLSKMDVLNAVRKAAHKQNCTMHAIAEICHERMDGIKKMDKDLYMRLAGTTLQSQSD